jgi:5'(3')-deoxyribonucleotidase
VSEPRLFLDLDGVLADFDAGVEALLGMSVEAFERTRSKRDFWFRLMRADDFYGSLPEMPDARILFDAVEHLKPTILTGMPIGKWAAPQKERWVAAHFPGTPVITTLARDKHKHMLEGDVLVDDRETHRAAYEAAGMVFVHHRNARESLAKLARIYPSVMLP